MENFKLKRSTGVRSRWKTEKSSWMGTCKKKRKKFVQKNSKEFRFWKKKDTSPKKGHFFLLNFVSFFCVKNLFRIFPYLGFKFRVYFGGFAFFVFRLLLFEFRSNGDFSWDSLIWGNVAIGILNGKGKCLPQIFWLLLSSFLNQDFSFRRMTPHQFCNFFPQKALCKEHLVREGSNFLMGSKSLPSFTISFSFSLSLSSSFLSSKGEKCESLMHSLFNQERSKNPWPSPPSHYHNNIKNIQQYPLGWALLLLEQPPLSPFVSHKHKPDGWQSGMQMSQPSSFLGQTISPWSNLTRQRSWKSWERFTSDWGRFSSITSSLNTFKFVVGQGSGMVERINGEVFPVFTKRPTFALNSRILIGRNTILTRKNFNRCYYLCSCGFSSSQG